MNRILNIVKLFLGFILVVLNVIYIHTFGLCNQHIIYLVFYVIFFMLLIKDFIKNNKIITDNIYNLLCLFVELLMIFIVCRALFDPSFLYNSSYYDTLLEMGKVKHLDSIKDVNINYMNQNCLYFALLLILLLIYRKINVQKMDSKYSMISLSCFYASICTIIPTITYISSTKDNVLWFLVLNIMLVSTEIYRLIKDNRKKREWIIYVSFFFNMWAFISILINMFY